MSSECSRCQTRTSEDSNFCSHCGRQLVCSTISQCILVCDAAALEQQLIAEPQTTDQIHKLLDQALSGFRKSKTKITDQHLAIIKALAQRDSNYLGNEKMLSAILSMSPSVLRTMLEAGVLVTDHCMTTPIDNAVKQHIMLTHVRCAVAERMLAEMVLSGTQRYGFLAQLVQWGFVPRYDEPDGVRRPITSTNDYCGSIESWCRDRQTNVNAGLRDSLPVDLIRLVCSFEFEGWRTHFNEVKLKKVRRCRKRLREIDESEENAHAELATKLQKIGKERDVAKTDLATWQAWMNLPTRAYYLRVEAVPEQTKSDEDEEDEEEEEDSEAHEELSDHSDGDV